MLCEPRVGPLPLHKESLNHLQLQERLVGDCLLTSSFLSYTGAFTFNYRHAMVYDMWNKDVSERAIPLTQPCECWRDASRL